VRYAAFTAVVAPALRGVPGDAPRRPV